MNEGGQWQSAPRQDWKGEPRRCPVSILLDFHCLLHWEHRDAKCVIGGIGLCKVMQATTEKSAEIILSLPLTHRFRIVTYALQRIAMHCSAAFASCFDNVMLFLCVGFEI